MAPRCAEAAVWTFARRQRSGPRSDVLAAPLDAALKAYVENDSLASTPHRAGLLVLARPSPGKTIGIDHGGVCGGSPRQRGAKAGPVALPDDPGEVGGTANKMVRAVTGRTGFVAVQLPRMNIPVPHVRSLSPAGNVHAIVPCRIKRCGSRSCVSGLDSRQNTAT